MANPLQGTYGGGTYDAFVSKINISGSALSYSTYLGGSSNDYGNSIAVDTANNAYASGWTSSTDFPLANPLQGSLGGSDDVFVSKLNTTGSALSYSTYLGGSGRDNAWGITVDNFGNAYVTGFTWSADFPLANPLQEKLGGTEDAFVAKIGEVCPDTNADGVCDADDLCSNTPQFAIDAGVIGDDGCVSCGLLDAYVNVMVPPDEEYADHDDGLITEECAESIMEPIEDSDVGKSGHGDDHDDD